ncbi:MAG: tetratricopeptide repeat protein [Pirellulaceae bacterium]
MVPLAAVLLYLAMQPPEDKSGQLPEVRDDAHLPLPSPSPVPVAPPAAETVARERLPEAAPLPQTVPALYQEAAQEATRLLERFPERADSYEIMARVEVLQGKSSEATRHWEEALRRNPNYAYAYDGLASVAAKRGDDEEAIRLYRQSLAIAAHAPQTWLELARVLVKLGRLEEAREALKKNLELDPRSFDGHLLLGQVLFQLQDYAGAKEQYANAAAIAPEQPKPYYGLGMACQRLNQVEEARKYLAKNSSIRARATETADLQEIFSDTDAARRDVAKIYVTMGRIYGALHSLPEAERLLWRAGQLDANNTESQLHLCALLLQAGQQDKALTVVEQLADRKISNPYHCLEVAVLYARLRRLDEAESMLAQCRERASGETWAFRESARFYLAVRRNPGEALRWAQEAVARQPNAEDYALLGEASLRLGDNRGAAAAFRRAQELDPENPNYAKQLERIGAPL